MKRNSQQEGISEEQQLVSKRDELLALLCPIKDDVNKTEVERCVNSGELRQKVRHRSKAEVFSFLDKMYIYFLTNPDKVMLIEYWMDPHTDKSFTQTQLRTSTKTRTECREYYDQLSEMLATRIAKLALVELFNPTFAKYLLGARHKGWQEVNRVSSEVEITQRVIDFKWRQLGDMPTQDAEEVE